MIPISRFGLGLAALGRPAYINVARDLPLDRSVPSLRAATWAVLDAAYAAGVRRVDVARSYGRAEEFLAGWLAARDVSDVQVSSKWGYTYVGEWRVDAAVHEVKAHTLDRFHAQYAETRSLLDPWLYQVHSLTVDSPLFSDNALLDALADAAASGQRLGFSTSGPEQPAAIRRGLALERSGVRLFTAVQSTWNLLEPSAGDALAEAHADGAHVTVKEAIANGRLAAGPPAAVRELADRHGVGPDAVALAAAVQPWADSVLLGPASTAQLAANLRAADLSAGVDLPDVARDARRYWTERSRLVWD